MYRKLIDFGKMDLPPKQFQDIGCSNKALLLIGCTAAVVNGWTATANHRRPLLSFWTKQLTENNNGTSLTVTFHLSLSFFLSFSAFGKHKKTETQKSYSHTPPSSKKNMNQIGPHISSFNLGPFWHQTSCTYLAGNLRQTLATHCPKKEQGKSLFSPLGFFFSFELTHRQIWCNVIVINQKEIQSPNLGWILDSG